jgi:hypothetical protein
MIRKWQYDTGSTVREAHLGASRTDSHGYDLDTADISLKGTREAPIRRMIPARRSKGLSANHGFGADFENH